MAVLEERLNKADIDLHYNGSNGFLFVNASKIYQFEVKDSKIKYYTLCSSNISKDFTINNLKKNRFKTNIKYFYVDFNPIYTNDILDIHRYLMKEA